MSENNPERFAAIITSTLTAVPLKLYIKDIGLPKSIAHNSTFKNATRKACPHLAV